MLNKLKSIIKEPYLIIFYLASKGILNSVNDSLFIKLMYYTRKKKKINLDNPIGYNEKIQWLKLYDRKKIYTQIVDKYEVRKYVENRIGKKYLNDLIGVYDDINEINFNELPSTFVLKTTHDSGTIIICDDIKKFDINNCKKKLSKSLNRNYYYLAREWPYKNVTPRIICEKYLISEIDEELKDYRFFCFNGEPRFIAVDININDANKVRRNLYSLEWDLLDVEISYPNEKNVVIKKPDKLDEMIELSKKLSSGFPHSRIDLYYINKKIIFGEITFFHQSGFGEIQPLSFEMKMGEWIILPSKTIE